MAKKTIRVFGTYYTETEKGRGYAEEYDFTTDIETDLSGGELKSFVQKKFIETFLRKQFGRDKFKGWQTCDVQELGAPAEVPTPAQPAGRKAKAVIEKDLGGL